MRQLYNCVALVLSWRDKEDDYTATAFRSVDQYIKTSFSAGRNLHASKDIVWSKEIMDAIIVPHFLPYEWKVLARLFERDSFGKIRVLQELDIESNTVVRYGYLTTRLEYIEGTARSLLANGWAGALKQAYGGCQETVSGSNTQSSRHRFWLAIWSFAPLVTRHSLLERAKAHSS